MATGFRLSDPQEYRRGVVLGLTLAEVLVLLVFLLLLSMAALLLRKERERDVLLLRLDHYTTMFQPLTKALASRGMPVDDTDGLASLIERGSEAESLRTRLKEARQQLDAAAAKAAQLSTENETLAAVLERIPGSPGQPPKERIDNLVRRAAANEALAAFLEHLPGGPAQPPQEKLDNLVKRAAANEGAIANLTGQNNQMRTELLRVKGNGGSGLPYCWAFPDGKAQYMLKVEMLDDGVIVRDIDPRVRAEDPVWQMLDAVTRERLMPLVTFLNQVAPLQARASTDRCRYSILVVDSTGRTNKPGYKDSMGRLWTAFNIHEVSR
nr:hypothetical protein [uncultured Rhodopila sp.]